MTDQITTAGRPAATRTNATAPVHAPSALDAIAQLQSEAVKKPPVPLPPRLAQPAYASMRAPRQVAPEKMNHVLQQLDTFSRVNFAIEDAMILLYRLALHQRETEWQASVQEAEQVLTLGKEVYTKMMKSADLAFASSIIGASMTIGSATISAGFGAYGYKASVKAEADAMNLKGQGLGAVGVQSVLQIGQGFSQMTEAAGTFASAGANFASKQTDADVELLQAQEKYAQVETDMAQKFADEMHENITTTRSTLEAIEQSRNRGMSAIYEV